MRRVVKSGWVFRILYFKAFLAKNVNDHLSRWNIHQDDAEMMALYKLLLLAVMRLEETVYVIRKSLRELLKTLADGLVELVELDMSIDDRREWRDRHRHTSRHMTGRQTDRPLDKQTTLYTATYRQQNRKTNSLTSQHIDKCTGSIAQPARQTNKQTNKHVERTNEQIRQTNKQARRHKYRYTCGQVDSSTKKQTDEEKRKQIQRDNETVDGKYNDINTLEPVLATVIIFVFHVRVCPSRPEVIR